MSRNDPRDLEKLALEYDCAYCGAQYGNWCVTTSSAWATWLHGVRQYPIQQAFGAGYQEFEDYVAKATYAEVIRMWEWLRKRTPKP